ncbi:MAG: hypothetical protein K6G84_07215 [Lachnospiraceae bacterium]|nr:hypothetical protein [Lachnospiraceae bacterium]
MPRDNAYEQSYAEKDSEKQNRVYDDDIKSFMANEGAAADSMYNAAGERNTGISNALGNIKAKMKKENIASKTEAVAQAGKMDPVLDSIAEIINKSDAGKLQQNDNYAEEKTRKIISKANDWNEKSSQYYKKTFMARYNNYDNLATTYYIMSRSNRNALDNDSEKKIAEHVETLSVDANDIKGKIRNLRDPQNPPAGNVTRDVVRNQFGKLRKSGMSGVGEENHHSYKYHKKITMKGKDSATGEILRYKVGKDFQGYRAKRQYAAPAEQDSLRSQDDKDKLVDSAGGAKGPNQGADTMNLLADAKAANNAYLYSAETAKQYKTKGGHNGYYINGEFISTEANDAEAKSKDKEKDIKEKEEIRTAIRNSSFFAHINSRTIQQYMTYDDGGERGKLKDDIDNLVNDASIAQGQDAVKDAVVYLTNTYLFDAHTTNAPDINSDKITNLDKDQKVQVVKYLLSVDNKPRTWDFAKQMVEQYIKGLAKERLKYLGNHSGEMMRMTLWDELNTERKVNSDDVLNSVMKEEYANMKGNTFLFSQNKIKALWSSGELLKNVNTFMGLSSSIVGTVNSGLKAFDVNKDDDTDEIKNARKDRLDKSQKANDWVSFGSEVSSLLNDTDFFNSYTGTAFAGVSGAALIVLGKTKDDKSVSEVLAGKGNTLSTAAKIKSIYLIVKEIMAWHEMRKKREKTESKINAIDDPNNQELKEKFVDRNENGGADQAVKCIKILEQACVLISAVTEEWKYYYTEGKDKHKWDTEEFAGSIKDLLGIVRGFIEVFRGREVRELNKSKIASVEGTLRDLEGNNLKGEAEKNKQAQFMLSLTKSAKERENRKVRANMASSSFGMIGNAASIFNTLAGSDKSNVMGGWAAKLGIGNDKAKNISGFIKSAAGFAGKLTSVGQIFSDKAKRGEIQRDVVKEALGDSKYWTRGIGRADYFGEVLNEETGIKSKHYLADLSRIFSAIDTHSMIKQSINPAVPRQTFELSKRVMQNFYSNLNGTDDEVRDKFKKVKLNDILKETGFSGNWRVMLKNSITNKL